jgi:hypothetical protein
MICLSAAYCLGSTEYLATPNANTSISAIATLLELHTGEKKLNVYYNKFIADLPGRPAGGDRHRPVVVWLRHHAATVAMLIVGAVGLYL